MQSSHSTHSSRFSSTMRSLPSVSCAKMLTGQTSTSFLASAASAATARSTWTSMNMPAISMSLQAFLHERRDVLDPLRHRDAGGLHALDLVGRGVGLPLDDRAGVAEAHAGHLVHEATRHEGDDRQPRPVLADPVSELRLHAAARLRVDDDRLRLAIRFEERHQLGVGGADDRVAADRDGGRLPEAGGRERVADLGRHAARARHDPDRPLLEGAADVHRRAAEAAHLGFLGREDAEAVGADDARAAQAGELHHLRHLAARDALGDDHDELHARLDGLEDGVAREARRHGHDRAVDVLPRGDVPYAGVDGHAGTGTPGAAGRDAAHDLRPVVEALARQVHRLAPGDARDDDRRIPVDEDGHQPFILATARPAASYRDTVRSQYSTPYLRRIVNPSSSHAPGMRKMAIVSAGLRPASTQPLITPRATMSTRVLETTFIMTAIFFTPGFERMSLVSSHAFLTLGLPPISQ